VKYLKEYKIFENLSKVDKKVRLIEDLTIELIDMDIKVDIYKGGSNTMLGHPHYDIIPKDKIACYIYSDMDEYMIFKKIINDITDRFKSFGLNPRSISGGQYQHNEKIYYFRKFLFDKWGKMTEIDYELL
jgi:hypothetical protein